MLVYDVCEVPADLVARYEMQVVSLDEIVEKADFISLHIPLTNKTRNIISSKELDRMKPNAVLANKDDTKITQQAKAVNDQI